MKVKGTLTVLACSIGLLLYGQNSLRFENISTPEGLGHSHLFAIKSDINGLIWIGSWDGLTCYDGYEFTNFSPAKTNPGLAGSNVISVIEPDSLGHIWFGTEGAGMSVFLPGTDTFINYRSVGAEGKRLSDNNVGSICHFKDMVWIGTAGGISVLDRQSDSVANYSLEESGLKGQVISMVKTGPSRAFIATPGGFARVSLEEKQLHTDTAFLASPPEPANEITELYGESSEELWIIRHKTIQCIRYREPGEIEILLELHADKIAETRGLDLHFKSILPRSDHAYWIATDHGLLSFTRDATAGFRLYRHDDLDHESLSGDILTGFCTDREENLWISTRFNGISKFDPRKQAFKKYSPRSGAKSSMTNNEVRALLQDRKGNTWIGYRNQGLDLYQPGQEKYIHFEDTASNLANFVRSLYEDEKGHIWIGTFDGFNILRQTAGGGYQSQQVKQLCGVELGTVYDFHPASDGRIWLGTSNGLFLYSEKGEESHLYKRRDDPLATVREYNIRDICEDTEGRLWLATDGGGVDVFHPDSGYVKTYAYQTGIKNSLSHNKVYCVYVDSDNRLWAGTQNGLNRLDEDGEGFEIYTGEEGLIDNVVYSIQEDEDQFLWISTANGLSRMQPENKTFQNYLKGFEFFDDAWSKNEAGEFLLGGADGYIRFHPKDVRTNHVAPLVRISSLELRNKPLKVNEIRNGRVILPLPLTQMAQLDLKHDENFFSIELLAVSLSDPQNIKYQYKLAGFNEQWINTDVAIRTAVFTNVPHGTYEFRYRAANADGIWSNEQVLPLIIHPAFHQTLGFKLAAGAIAVLLIIGAYWLRLRDLMSQKKRLKQEVEEKTSALRSRNLAIENQNRLLEKQKKEIEEQIAKVIDMSRQMHESDERKIKFFTNISHEIRTPLTLITGPIEKILESLRQDDPSYAAIKLVDKNSRRLVNLVNQLLDFRKIDRGHMPVKPVYSDLAVYTRELYDGFKSWADKKEIEFIFELEPGDYTLAFDPDILDKVIANLLSNALKYTPEKGQVILALSRSGDAITICVQDNGPGISEESRKSLFRRFYRAEHKDLQHIHGTGIGLALAKEMSILHGGDLCLLNHQGKGCRFQFTLPVAQNKTGNKSGQEELAGAEVPTLRQKEPCDDYTVLVVEDNRDLRRFIRDSLDCRHILEATHGEEGVRLAVEKMPDLIISDVLMPCKNGFELCKTLKEDPRTNHIPIILLTALGADEHMQAGINLGADDYIVKPFNHRILAGKVRNMMQARQSFRERIQQNLTGTSEDQKHWKDSLPPFVIQIIDHIENNLDQEKFGVEELCEIMCMSSSTLYRKMKLITQKSTVEFIREVRMRKALEYFQMDPQLQVSEVSLMIGFEDVDYFRKCFKKQFGKSPSEILRKTTVR